MSSKTTLRAAILVLSVLTVYMFLVQPALSAVGTGVLYVYTDTWGGNEAPKGGSKGNYLVETGKKYYIRIWGITEFDVGTKVTVKISWTDTDGNKQTSFIYNVEVKESSDGVRYVDVEWTVPSNAKICVTSTVHYTSSSKPKGPDYVASGQMSRIGHMHVIPTTFFGAIGALSALFASLGLHKILKKDKQR